MTVFEMAKDGIKRFDLRWPVDIRVVGEQYEMLESEKGKHTLYLCQNTESVYLNELFAGAKLAEMNDDPLLSSYRFEGIEDERVKEWAAAFFSLVLPVRTVWLHKVIRQHLDKKTLEGEIDFIEQIYHEWEEIGEHAETPHNFFAYYLLLQEEGRDVSPPPQKKRFEHTLWHFSKFANAAPSAKRIVEAYNAFAPPGLPRAELSENHKFRFLG